eukprot:s507_g21.t1
MPSCAPVTDGPTQCNQATHEVGDLLKAPDGGKHPVLNLCETPFPSAPGKSEHIGMHMQIQGVSHDGGLTAFASKVTPQVIVPHVSLPMPCQDKVGDDAPPAGTPDPIEGFSEEMADTAARVEMEEDITHQGTNFAVSPETIVVQLVHEDANEPYPIRINASATAGSITVAEAAMGTMTQPIRISTSVGTPVKLADTMTMMQQLFLREMSSVEISHACPQGIMTVRLMDTQPCTRLHLLLQQEAWVANDEMSFYLDMICSTGIASKGIPLFIPPSYEDDELEPILQRWICGNAPHDATPGTIITVLWVEDHWIPVVMLLQKGKVDILTTKDQVSHLLRQHGVLEDQSHERAKTVIEKIGRQNVARAMRLKDAWKELKNLANHQIPRLQLVLASELQKVIQARANQPKPVGDKQKKAKADRGIRPQVQITADDVSVPEGVFRDDQPSSMHQIPFGSIGPEARGIVVLQADKASPYLRIHQPISKYGLALIIVDHQHPSTQGVGELIRFPARCERTGEPILLTARMVQLGAVQVQRLSPEAKTRVEEVCNKVYRIVVYRDELESISWDTFISRPVKHMIAALPFLQTSANGVNPIIDLWDRQHLTSRFERTRPGESEVYMACVRLEQHDEASDPPSVPCPGFYVEPRTIDGRAPDPQYRVVWLTKADRQTAVLASQSTVQWNVVVRSGPRFGLRTKLSDAAEVHGQHKPNIPYLDGDKVMTFTAGPFPHGANRAALIKLFTKWNWPARPCQPKSRSPNGLGIIWEIQAVSRPPFEVYQLDHADVLITEIPRKEPRETRPVVDIQGSARTLAALTPKERKQAEEEDPWQKEDPWQNFQTPVKSAKVTKSETFGSDQFAESIIARVTQKLQDQSKTSHFSMHDGDTPMSSDHRIQDIEHRMQHLEETVQSHQAQQQIHNQEVSQQIAKVQTQVDAQSVTLQTHLDAKMDEQLAHIERLLSKRARQE